MQNLAKATAASQAGEGLNQFCNCFKNFLQSMLNHGYLHNVLSLDGICIENEFICMKRPLSKQKLLSSQELHGEMHSDQKALMNKTE